MNSKVIVLSVFTVLLGTFLVWQQLPSSNNSSREKETHHYSKEKLLEFANECTDPLVAGHLYEQTLDAYKTENNPDNYAVVAAYALFCHQNGNKNKAYKLLRSAIPVTDRSNQWMLSPLLLMVYLQELDCSPDKAWKLCMEERDFFRSRGEFRLANELPINHLIKHCGIEKAESFSIDSLKDMAAPEFQESRVATYFEIAELRVRQNKLEGARAMLKRGLAEDNNNSDARNLLAWCDAHTGRRKDAELYYRKELESMKPFTDLSKGVMGGPALDKMEYEYGARHDFLSFMKETGRPQLAKEHEEFCKELEATYILSRLKCYSYPRMPHTLRREERASEWNEKFQKQYKRAPAKSVLDGIGYLYGKYANNEFDLKRAVHSSEGAENRILALSQLHDHYARSNDLEGMTNTVTQMLELAHTMKKPLSFAAWKTDRKNETLNDWNKYEESFEQKLDPLLNQIYERNRNVVKLLNENNDKDTAEELVQMETDLYKLDGDGNTIWRIYDEDQTCRILAYYVQLFYLQGCYQQCIKFGDRFLRCVELRKRAWLAEKNLPPEISYCYDAVQRYAVRKCMARSFISLKNPARAKECYAQLLAEGDGGHRRLTFGGTAAQEIFEYAELCRASGDFVAAKRLDALRLVALKERSAELEAKAKTKTNSKVTAGAGAGANTINRHS